jgi:hypothetical protein
MAKTGTLKNGCLGTTGTLTQRVPSHNEYLSTACTLAQWIPWHSGYLGIMVTLAQLVSWHKWYLGTADTLAQWVHWHLGGMKHSFRHSVNLKYRCTFCVHLFTTPRLLHVCKTNLNIKKNNFFPLGVFMSFVYFSNYSSMMSLYSSNRLVLLEVKQFVVLKVETLLSVTFQLISYFKR